MPICHIIGAQSCGCPIMGIQFEFFIIGQLLLDTHVICMTVMRTLMASFALFPTVFKSFERHCRRFHSKKVLKRHFYFLKFVIDMIN